MTNGLHPAGQTSCWCFRNHLVTCISWSRPQVAQRTKQSHPLRGRLIEITNSRDHVQVTDPDSRGSDYQQRRQYRQAAGYDRALPVQR
ncbi:MAG TPA: hypothetical protein VKX46_16395 [Ktedonobacteraceae bacterium]|nr:hypothetical protein [Ktedonobacteraceae bacterium]